MNGCCLMASVGVCTEVTCPWFMARSLVNETSRRRKKESVGSDRRVGTLCNARVARLDCSRDLNLRISKQSLRDDHSRPSADLSQGQQGKSIVPSKRKMSNTKLRAGTKVTLLFKEQTIGPAFSSNSLSTLGLFPEMHYSSRIQQIQWSDLIIMSISQNRKYTQTKLAIKPFDVTLINIYIYQHCRPNGVCYRCTTSLILYTTVD